MKKSIVFLYTRNEQSEIKIKKQIPLTIVSEELKIRNKFNKRNVKLIH